MSRVTVLGGGVSGLTSAVRLAEDGNDVSVVAGAYTTGTTSWVATAIWHLFWVEIDDRVRRWATASLQELLRLANDASAGVALIRGIECIRANTPEAEEFESGTTEALWKAVVPAYTPLSRDELIGRLPLGYPVDTIVGGYEIDVPIADMSIYLPYLMDRLRQRDVTLSTADVASLDHLRTDHPADIYVNCTGLGARDLTGDTALKGVKGQIIRVDGAMVPTYIADDHSPSGMTYVLPRKTDIILGGTEDLGAEDSIVDPDVANSILERCQAIEPRLRSANVLEHLAGARPYRRSVRLELEKDVIHNYGHGGSGVSLSWGCAEDVVKLAAEATR